MGTSIEINRVYSVRSADVQRTTSSILIFEEELLVQAQKL